MPSLTDLKIPNGAVNNNKLTGNITSDQLANNTLTGTELSSSLNLSSKTLTLPTGVVSLADLPSGSVLGVYSTYGDYDYSFTTSNSYLDVPSFNLTFTTKATNSIFLCDIRSTGYSTAGYNGISIGLKLNSTLYVGSGNDHWCLYGNSYGSGTTTSYNPNRHMRVSPSFASGTSVTAQVCVGRWTNSGTSWLPGYNSSYTSLASLTIVEIKP